MYSLKLDTVRKGYHPEDDFCWIGPTVSTIDKAGTKILLLMRKGEIHKPGRWDIFSQTYQMLSSDAGNSWTGPHLAKGLENISSGDCEYVFGGNPKLHCQTGRCLVIGNRTCYQNNSLTYAPRGLEYSVFDEQNLSWRKPEELSGLEFAKMLAYNGGMQRLELPNGDILLPIYGTIAKGDRYFSIVAKCGFDGRELKLKEIGSIINLDIERGICEPSLTYLQGTYYLTLRNDLAGYVATSEDGLHFSNLIKWRFDDGTDLGSYNTQQHWVKHGDKLFLVYTRKSADNEHLAIVRHRAPLFMAQVDPQKLCVIRETEQIIIPERGAKLGNFDVVEINDKETWVVVAEWMEERPQLISREYGSDNSVFSCRLAWHK